MTSLASAVLTSFPDRTQTRIDGGPFINVGVAWELLHGAAELGVLAFVNSTPLDQCNKELKKMIPAAAFIPGPWHMLLEGNISHYQHNTLLMDCSCARRAHGLV